MESKIEFTNLIKYDKSICIKSLESADTSLLWSALLKGQIDLVWDTELDWLQGQPTWIQSQNILEFGSGNGAYLHKLACEFPQKTFRGVEKLSSSLDLALNEYQQSNLSFQLGDVTAFNPELVDSSDALLFRFILQHLENPLSALENVSKYLSKGGHIFITDAFDKASKSFPPIQSVKNALKDVVSYQEKTAGKGNREATLDLLKHLQTASSPLAEIYEVSFSNLDTEGNLLYENRRAEGALARKRYFNHYLLLLTILHKTYHISINLDEAYDELTDFLQNEQAWVSLGFHLLTLKKR